MGIQSIGLRSTQLHNSSLLLSECWLEIYIDIGSLVEYLNYLNNLKYIRYTEVYLGQREYILYCKIIFDGIDMFLSRGLLRILIVYVIVCPFILLANSKQN